MINLISVQKSITQTKLFLGEYFVPPVKKWHFYSGSQRDGPWPAPRSPQNAKQNVIVGVA